jgi:hypothetical protein
LEPGASIQLGEDELLLSKKEREFTYPILHLEHLGRVWEYYMPLRVDQEWRRVWTFLIQVDSDLGIRIAKPKQARPVPMDYAQPEGWPLIADAEVTSISGERQR